LSCYYDLLLLPPAHQRSDSGIVSVPVVSICGCRCVCGGVGVCVSKFLRKQDMIKTSDEFENGCTPMYCGAQMVI